MTAGTPGTGIAVFRAREEGFRVYGDVLPVPTLKRMGDVGRLTFACFCCIGFSASLSILLTSLEILRKRP